MKFCNERGSILKKGSRTGYLPISSAYAHAAVDPSLDLLLRTAQRNVFEDMWDTRGVGWICLESDAEDIICVVPRHVEIVCARLFVLEMQRG